MNQEKKEKTSQFTFKSEDKARAVYALTRLLCSGSHVLNISENQLCKYLERNSNLGKSESIRKSIQRRRNAILEGKQIVHRKLGQKAKIGGKDLI